MNTTLPSSTLPGRATHPPLTNTSPTVISPTITTYLHTLSPHQLHHQLTLRSLTPTNTNRSSPEELFTLLAHAYQADLNAGWSLHPTQHLLLKPAPPNAGITQETQAIVGRRLGYILPVDETYKYVYRVGFSGSEDVPLLLRPAQPHSDDNSNPNPNPPSHPIHSYALGMSPSLHTIITDTSNNHIGGPLVRDARTLYCRPQGGDARLVLGLQLEDMRGMGLVWCQLGGGGEGGEGQGEEVEGEGQGEEVGGEGQGKEICLAGDVALFPRGWMGWKDGEGDGEGDGI